METIEVTLTLDTLAYVAGDVLSDTAAIPNAVARAGAAARLRSIAVIDEDDQGAALDVLFFSANRSLGAKNGVPAISDADARDLLGFISIVGADYIDLGGVRIATKSGLDLGLEAAPASTDIYLSTITRGTPTHTVNGVRLRLGLEN